MQHESTNSNPEKIETLGNVMDLSLGYFCFYDKYFISIFGNFSHLTPSRSIIVAMLYRGSDVNSMMEFHSEISRYQMYSDSPTVDDLLYDMATQPIRKIGK